MSNEEIEEAPEVERGPDPTPSEDRIKTSIRLTSDQHNRVKSIAKDTGLALYRLQEIIFEAGLESDKLTEVIEYHRTLTK